MSAIQFSISFRSTILIFIVLFSCVTPSMGHDLNREEETQKLIDWFDGLGFKDFSKLQFVKVTTGWWSQSGNDKPKNETIPAFLINENKNGKFNVYTLGLSECSFEKTPTGTAEHEIVKFEKADLEEFCKDVLLAHNARKNGDDDTFRRFGEQVNEGTEFFVLARACAAQQKTKLVQQLLDEAGPLLKRFSDTSNGPTNFQEDLANDLANKTMWGIILDFGDTKIARESLYERLLKFEKNYPESRHFERAKKTSSLLKTMLAEEKTHQPPKDFDTLPVKEKVAELIFQLRDQNGQQFSQPGSCNIFFVGDFTFGMAKNENPDTKSAPESPAHHLVEIGFDAVPQLIDALKDRRLTRSVGFHRNFYFSHHVLRVGDCAQQILNRIANRSFYDRTHTNGAMVKDGKKSSVKEQVEAWYNEVKLKGEKQVLIDATERGDRNSIGQANRLLEKYPDDALDAIIAGARKTKTPWVQRSLIQLVSSTDKKGVDFLNEMMLKAPQLDARLTAAAKLHEHKPQISVNAMIEEWLKVVESNKDSNTNSRETSVGFEDLIEFLVSKNSPAAVKQIHKNFKQQPPIYRLDIVRAIWGTCDHGLTTNEAANNTPVKLNEAEKEIESLLITALQDKTRRTGISGSWGDFYFTNPRICDAAAYVLSQRIPNKYKINPNAAGDEATAQLVRAINIWRAENDLELLAEFVPRKAPTLSSEQTEPLINAFIDARNDRQRKSAAEKIRELGIAALPDVLKKSNSLPADSPQKPGLSKLVRQLSSTTTKVSIAKDSAPVSTELRKRFDEFKNKPLTSERIVNLLVSIATDKLPKGATGIQITASRSNGLSGVEIEFALTKTWPAENGTQQMWNSDSSITLDSRSLGSRNGSTSLEYARTKEAYHDFTKSVNKVVDSPYETPFTITFSLIRDK